jgi:hypothetical protein
MAKKQDFFLKRSVIATLGIIALLGGFVFINSGFLTGFFVSSPTGNFVVSEFQPFSILSILGMLLILCSAILIVYSIVKK